MSDIGIAKDKRSPDPKSDAIPADDPHKTEKLTKQGRDDLDPDEGSD